MALHIGGRGEKGGNPGSRRRGERFAMKSNENPGQTGAIGLSWSPSMHRKGHGEASGGNLRTFQRHTARGTTEGASEEDST